MKKKKRTVETYKQEILTHYKRGKGGELSGYLVEPTPALVKQACIARYSLKTSKEDLKCLKQFFKLKDGDDVILAIEKTEVSKFKPAVNFFKEEVKNPNHSNLELIAWLINFKPRPLYSYIQTENLDPNKEFQDVKAKESRVSTTDSLNSTKDNKVNKRSALIVVLLICALGSAIYFFSQEPNSQTKKCMVWVKTEYQIIECTTNLQPEYEADILPFDAHKFKNFKKINVTISTGFFDEVTNKPLVWYAKNNEEIEYFSGPGLHPTTGKTLRAITPYIINKYVPVHFNNKNSFLSE